MGDLNLESLLGTGAVFRGRGEAEMVDGNGSDTERALSACVSSSVRQVRDHITF